MGREVPLGAALGGVRTLVVSAAGAARDGGRCSMVEKRHDQRLDRDAIAGAVACAAASPLLDHLIDERE